MRLLSLVLAFAAALALAPPVASTPRAVELVAKEFLYAPKDVAVQPGDVTFVVSNQGAIEHSLVVGVLGGSTFAQISIIEPGETRSIVATLPAGTYKIYCSLPGHRDAGMVATLRVSP